MKNEFRICNLCRGVPFEKLKKRLQEMDPEAEFRIGCQNVCGIGRKQPFVIVNKRLVTSDNLDELMKQVKEHLK